MKFFLIFFSFLIFSFSSFAIDAENSRILDSSFYEWNVYETQDSELDEKKCFMIAHPKNSDSDNQARKESYLMITRYQGRRIEEVSLYMGMNYKLNSKVLISIDDIKFSLNTNEDMAYARSSFDDAAIIQIMLDSSYLKARADSDNGTFAIDDYSLKGVARAYSRMRYICR